MIPPNYDAAGNITDPAIRLFRCTLTICEPCIDGKGHECHTPGCALWLHTVSLPISRDLMTKCELVYEEPND